MFFLPKLQQNHPKIASGIPRMAAMTVMVSRAPPPMRMIPRSFRCDAGASSCFFYA